MFYVRNTLKKIFAYEYYTLIISEMRRKHFSIFIFAFISICIWIIWSSQTEMDSTLLVEKNNYDFMKNYILRPSSSVYKSSPFITIIVMSYVGHVKLRNAHRKAMPQNVLKSLNVTRVFLLAEIPSDEKYITQADVVNENRIHNDLLQGSFIDNYRNLTYKHLLGLKWASDICRPAYILKVDDDIVFNFDSTYKFLLHLDLKDDFLLGYMLNNTVPKRNKDNKWYVTTSEYAGDYYPQYISGWYYITTPNTAAKLCDEALYRVPFWIDDIYITGIIRKALGIKLKHVPKDFWLEYYELLECCISDMIKKFVKCDFVVGPNGGRNNLIVEFNQALNNCEKLNNCMMRQTDKPLKKVCVMKRDRDIFSDGHGEVKLLR